MIDPLNKPEYSTLAAAYKELHDMACELAQIAKKQDRTILLVAEMDTVRHPHKPSDPRYISRGKIASYIFGLENKTVTVEPNGDVSIAGTIHQHEQSPERSKWGLAPCTVGPPEIGPEKKLKNNC